jgi:hypothetical protein
MISQLLLADLLHFIIYATLLILSGLAVRLSASSLGPATRRSTPIDGGIIRSLLVRKSPLETFIRIYGWNVAVSSLVIFSGSITLGVLPAVWAFINLGVLFPDLNLFKIYAYPWVEETANVLSVAFGMWIGRNLDVLLSSPAILPWIALIIPGTYMISVLLETYEIHRSEDLISPAC